MYLSKHFRKLLNKSAFVKLLVVAISTLTPGGDSHDFSFVIVSPSGYQVSMTYSASKGESVSTK